MNERVRELVEVLIVLAAAAAAIAGLGLLAVSCWFWLQTGTWHAPSMLDSLSWAHAVPGYWATKPLAWVGVWKILNEMPAWLSLILVAITLIWVVLAGPLSSDVQPKDSGI